MAAGALMIPATAAPLPAIEAMTVRCAVETACAADGTCAEGDGAHALRIRPIFTREDGSTRLELQIDGRLRDGSAVTDAGPILWREGREAINTLLLLGDGEVLWHRPGARADRPPILFLICEDAP